MRFLLLMFGIFLLAALPRTAQAGSDSPSYAKYKLFEMTMNQCLKEVFAGHKYQSGTEEDDQLAQAELDKCIARKGVEAKLEGTSAYGNAQPTGQYYEYKINDLDTLVNNLKAGKDGKTYQDIAEPLPPVTAPSQNTGTAADPSPDRNGESLEQTPSKRQIYVPSSKGDGKSDGPKPIFLPH